VDLTSPSVTNDSAWQNILGVAYDIRCDDSTFVKDGRYITTSAGPWVQVLLAVTQKGTTSTTFFSPHDFNSHFVMHSILVDNMSDPEKDPIHWMAINGNVGGLPNYVINNVIIRFFGTGASGSGQNFGPFGCNVDNVRPITVAPSAVTGKVSVALTSQAIGCSQGTGYTHDVDVTFDSGFSPYIALTGATLNFTGSNIQKGTVITKPCDIPNDQRIIDNSLDNRHITLSFVGLPQFVPGLYQTERVRFSTVLKKVSGTTAPVASDFNGANLQLTFAGLPGSCTVPLANFAPDGTSRATATFQCAPPAHAPASSPRSLALLALALVGSGSILSLAYARRARTSGSAAS
jgi:hypothetical protein